MRNPIEPAECLHPVLYKVSQAEPTGVPEADFACGADTASMD